MGKTTLLICLLSTWSFFSQVVINEIDADTQGMDTKEFVELKSDTPFFSLEGYVLAFLMEIRMQGMPIGFINL